MDPNNPTSSPSPKQQVVERLRQATNVLVTVRSNPSVDELAAALGLTLMLNKLGKHATAVFSGQVPSTLEFLKPEETIETNTDSLRDFIVSLDKSKADKLRYKVEENVVKIFITPYRTSITEKDLEFTQGDFNVDVVMALGVTQREELDQAIVAHGRILHDATVIGVIAGQHESSLGNISWQEPAASSLSEMLVSISEAFQGGLIDAQMATAFLTGIVAETDRFSNPKTSPKVMTMAAQLMAAGANQQLIANELQKGDPLPPVVEPAADSPAGSDGSLSISHDQQPAEEAKPEEAPAEVPLVPQEENKAPEPFLPPLPPSEAGEGFNPLMPEPAQPEPPEEEPESPAPEPDSAAPVATTPEELLPPQPAAPEPSPDQIEIDHEGNLMRTAPSPKHKVISPLPADEAAGDTTPSFLPPAPDDGSSQTMVNPLDEQPAAGLASAPNELPPMPELPPDQAPEILPDDTTLQEIEESVHSPHLEQQEAARSALDDVYAQAPFDPAGAARNDLNAMPLGGVAAEQVPNEPFPLPGADPSNQMPAAVEENQDNSIPPPPVPPPLMPPQ